MPQECNSQEKGKVEVSVGNKRMKTCLSCNSTSVNFQVKFPCEYYVSEPTLTQFVPQTRLSRFRRVVASARRRETFVRDGYRRFCVLAIERESPS